MASRSGAVSYTHLDVYKRQKPRNASGLNVYKGVTSATDLFYYISFDKKNAIEVIKDNGNHHSSIKLNGEAIDLAANEKSVFVLLPKEKSIDVYNILQGNFTRITGKGDAKIKKPVGMVTVSYTHLDVYKRQISNIGIYQFFATGSGNGIFS